MLERSAAIIAFLGSWLGPPIDLATALLGAILPLDLAKAIVVVCLYIIGLQAIRIASKGNTSFVARLALAISILLLITAGVSASGDHIDRTSFWFGPYVELIENHF